MKFNIFCFLEQATDQAESLDDACMNDLSVLKAVTRIATAIEIYLTELQNIFFHSKAH